MVPMRSVHRDRLTNIRYNMRGTSKVYRTANNIDGAKSSGKTVPPIGAGNRTIFRKWFEKRRSVLRIKKVRDFIVDFNDLRS